MAHRQLKIEANFYETPGNPRTAMSAVLIPFKTTDSEGRVRFFNRSGAVARLIFFLLDNRLITFQKFADYWLKWDLSEKKDDYRNKYFEELESEFEGGESEGGE